MEISQKYGQKENLKLITKEKFEITRKQQLINGSELVMNIRILL
jgi:hypothetical protein